MVLIFHEFKAPGKYSQFSEWGMLKEIAARVKPESKTAVEFGAPSWEFCSNTAEFEDMGWHVKMYDLNPHDKRVNKATITPENVNEKVGDCAVLSIDCDGPDYHIWKAYQGKAPIVVIEVDSSILPPREVIAEGRYATSYYSMVKLGIEKGYFLVAHTGNCIFVRNEYRDLFPECVGDGLSNWEDYFDKQHL